MKDLKKLLYTLEMATAIVLGAYENLYSTEKYTPQNTVQIREASPTRKSETQKYKERFDAEHLANRNDYERKPVIEVTVSNMYTDASAWGHTLIGERKINMRPPESIDDSLGVFPHEVTHNFFPNLRNESYVSMIGNGPMRDYIIKSFRYSVHR